MNRVYAIAANTTSSLGMDTVAHWRAISSGKTGIRRYEDSAFGKHSFYASRIEPACWQVIQERTRATQVLSPFEQMALFSIKQAIQECTQDIDLAETVFILSTTKGNIEWLGQVPGERLLLHRSAAIIAKELGITNKAVVISQACVSGIVALQHGLRLLQAGRYKNAIITGCDRFTRFVLSGFQSFHAIADAPCQPFDKFRKGINLGECAATIILSTGKDENTTGELIAGATSNDANHISGPSRTGEELAMAVSNTLKEANIAAGQIDMISAHGTATPYNDEMEAKAFCLAGLQDAPLHSLKGFTGHSLGASGVMESAIVLESLRHQQLVPSAGFEIPGVSKPIHVTTQMQSANIEHVLKTASGFGGSNAAIVWRRV